MAGTVTPDPAAPTMTWEQHHEAGRRRFAEGDAAGAEHAFRAAIARAEQSGGDPLQRASSLSSLGQLKYQQKDYKGAEDSFRQSLELREAALGADHPTVISGINNLAALFVARGALDEAEPLLQRAMAVTVKRVEATQAELAVNLNNLVRLYVKRGDYSRAEPLVVRLLALKRPLGPEHPDVAAVSSRWQSCASRWVSPTPRNGCGAEYWPSASAHSRPTTSCWRPRWMVSPTPVRRRGKLARSSRCASGLSPCAPPHKGLTIRRSSRIRRESRRSNNR